MNVTLISENITRICVASGHADLFQRWRAAITRSLDQTPVKPCRTDAHKDGDRTGEKLMCANMMASSSSVMGLITGSEPAGLQTTGAWLQCAQFTLSRFCSGL